ncbi:quinohemoprotein amine dehydrogenase subunit beta [Neptunomonas sp. XY-337]|uniref:quinohemoprotein amine dehydrogenase subunit beta n=1 Tax=Neptunomonas sp. XY-337 TaxID=2561897 RepID=UPI0010A9A076|nr:quinohemoprotein amine dehydrogenase subunit beta [Neptunomonas sp. XY-337]
MTFSRLFKAVALMSAASGAALLTGCAANPMAEQGMKAGGHEYVLTVTRPNQLHIIDTETKDVVRSCDVPGTFGSGSIASSPDGRIAYVLTAGTEKVVGFDIRNCDIVFAANQSINGERVKTFVSLAVSNDGKELYTVQNPTRKLNDRYDVLQPRLAVYDTAAGLNAKPLRTYPVDRRITKIAVMGDGRIVLGGADLTAINPNTGEVKMLSKIQNWNRAGSWVPPDAFAMFNQGEHVGEYIMPYFTIKWNGAPGDMEKAEFWWGMNRIDLASGEVEETETVPFEFIVFNWITDPLNKDILYGAFNQLSKHDISKKETVAAVDLDHTFYSINMDSNRTIYIGGASSDISVHNPDTLEKIASIQLTGDMSSADLRVVKLH